jgi:hypothetical protein
MRYAASKLSNTKGQGALPRTRADFPVSMRSKLMVRRIVAAIGQSVGLLGDLYCAGQWAVQHLLIEGCELSDSFFLAGYCDIGENHSFLLRGGTELRGFVLPGFVWTYMSYYY